MNIFEKESNPAFPCEPIKMSNGEVLHYMGMSLRDYFAAKVMQGLLSDSRVHPGSVDDIIAFQKRIARLSYQYADAMLEVRR